MELGKENPSHGLQQFLRVYQIEPIGQLSSGWLRLPLPVVWFLFAVLYFGVLFILHRLVGTPRPTNFGDIFRHPSTFFYYPNLIAIAYDFMGNPLLLVLLVFFRSHIPTQFVRLEQSGFISEKSATSRVNKLLHFLGTNSQAQTLMAVILPLLIALLGLIVDVMVYLPQGAPSQYAVFLSLLGRYARVAALVQFVYVFIIIANYKLDFKFHFNHPDECSGLAPFGKLATSGYAYLFVHAMIEAIGTTAGGTAFERALRSITGSFTLVYLWILFPIAAIFIFSQLIRRPHCVLRKLQEQYLWNASTAWTSHHQQLTSSIARAVEQSKTPLAARANYHFADDLELLEVWAKLNKYVEDMHTWPIPKRTFRIIAVLGNPLIPVLLPIVVDAVRNFLP